MIFPTLDAADIIGESGLFALTWIKSRRSVRHPTTLISAILGQSKKGM